MTTGCTTACREPTPVQAHCPTCHRTFGSAGGFDLHREPIDGRRRGFREPAATGPLKRCLDPAGLGMTERDGVWRREMTDADKSRRWGGESK